MYIFTQIHNFKYNLLEFLKSWCQPRDSLWDPFISNDELLMGTVVQNTGRRRHHWLAYGVSFRQFSLDYNQDTRLSPFAEAVNPSEDIGKIIYIFRGFKPLVYLCFSHQAWEHGNFCVPAQICCRSSFLLYLVQEKERVLFSLSIWFVRENKNPFIPHYVSSKLVMITNPTLAPLCWFLQVPLYQAYIFAWRLSKTMPSSFGPRTVTGGDLSLESGRVHRNKNKNSVVWLRHRAGVGDGGVGGVIL